MIQELDRVVLSRPIEALDLRSGAIGTVVLVHDGGRAFEVEFSTPDGDTRALATVSATHVRALDAPGAET